MEIHWLADVCVVAGLLTVAYFVAPVLRLERARKPPEIRRSRLSAALEGGRTGAWVWEIATRHFFCDSRACRNLGVAPGSVLNLDQFLERVAATDRVRVESEMHRAAGSPKPFELVVCINAQDGSERFVELTGEAEVDGYGKPFRQSGTLRDVTAQRRRNADLRRQSQIFAQVHDAIIATTPDNHILVWNEGAERIYGYSAAEAVGRPIQMLWFSRDRETLDRELVSMSSVSDTHEFVSRVRHKSGVELYAHFRLAPMRDPDGWPIGLLACSHDVTRQREEHEILTLQANALESIREAVVVTDKHCAIMHANPASADLFGIDPRAEKRSGISNYLFGDQTHRAAVMLGIQSAVSGGGNWSGEIDCARPSGGEPIKATVSVHSLNLDSGPAWVWVLRDVTEQRRAEDALKERERRFRNLADSAPLMVWMTNADGSADYVNQSWLDHTGFSRRQSAGFGWVDAFPDSRERLIGRVDGSLTAPQPFETESLMKRHDGVLSYILCRGVPRYEGGEFKGYIGSNVDITNIKKAEQERIAFEQQALQTQKMHSLGVLAGGIAHDFNNMLVSVLGFSDLALRELEARHPARELVEQIELGSRRAAALVEQVLTFAGKARKANEDVDINEAVLEMVGLLERAIGPKIAFNLDLDANLPAFMGDPAQVRQVAMNLILNASDALGDEGGRIRIRTTSHESVPDAPQNWIMHEGLAPGPYVALEVHDAGCGMDQHTIAQIFDPFFTTKFTGRGLGLSAVMGVVRSHAGSIRVESTPGGGASFAVLFPLSHQRVVDPAEPLRRASGEPCILIIDDDPTVLEASRQMLQSGGIRVFCAHTETEAIETLDIHSDAIQLALLDVVMPNSNPRDLARRLVRTSPGLQILLTSGFSDSRLRPAIDGRHVVGFLPKPYNRDQLLKAVSRTCPAIVRNVAEDAASARGD